MRVSSSFKKKIGNTWLVFVIQHFLQLQSNLSQMVWYKLMLGNMKLYVPVKLWKPWMPEIIVNVTVLQEKSQPGARKLKKGAATVISLWFEVCYCILIFVVTSHKTTNFPSILQPGVQSFLNRWQNYFFKLSQNSLVLLSHSLGKKGN